MLKYLVVALVVVVVLWLMFGLPRRKPKPPQRGGQPAAPGRRGGPPEPMLTCAHCGMHLPRGDALIAAGQAYCCAEHRDAGPRDDG
jgi:uncharacterized protein